jgi:hypothetical protein
MVETNHTKAARARHAGKGGARAGAGRPLGSRETRPRKGTASEKTRFEALQADYGLKCKERDDLQRQVENLRYQLNFGRRFEGDSKALFEAVMKGDYHASQEQLYSAKMLFDREYPRDVPGEYQVDESGKVILYLPNNRRDPDLNRNEDEAFVTAQLDRLWRAQKHDRVEQLRKWVSEGSVCEPCAIRCYSQWKEDEDAPWEPTQPNGATVKPQPAPLQYIMQPVVDPEISLEVSSKPPNGKQTGAAQVQVRLYAYPGRGAMTARGNRYCADANSEIWVDPEDVAELLQRGWRERR